VVTLDDEWVKLASPKGYFAMVPFPLPREATAQNLALYIQAWLWTGEEGVQRTDAIKLRTLCHRIGLRTNKARLNKIVEIESKWLQQRHSFGVWLIDGDDPDSFNIKPGRVAFVLERPRVPRRKKTEQGYRRFSVTAYRNRKNGTPEGPSRPQKGTPEGPSNLKKGPPKAH
jgi:hypothetical protein